ncbi:Retrovirus-related Pol polyprotein from type-1 retrotransposable element R1 [Eumeta japonica]|uniref:Retrovirus-related Pol polyprotein from type-1 retrotransposable element R1 n=1 Tax=Eumeta variegata TaxID=151549 RepID=A0A4C1V8C9_EUMVA|nr:Retrovirus-related Pol polyprotein from type-1 retrotransposable element R1 [Eumeta japonica]
MFCNLILDSLLRGFRELGIYVLAFADDLVLMFSGQSASSIEEEANRALACVHCWGVRNKLRFAASKTNSMVLTKKLKYDDPVVYMNDAKISLVGEIRLLGMTVDRKLTGKLAVPKMLDAVQRSVALKACWAQRTVSLHSALILSRLLPLDIRVREAVWLYEVKRG